MKNLDPNMVLFAKIKAMLLPFLSCEMGKLLYLLNINSVKFIVLYV